MDPRCLGRQCGAPEKAGGETCACARSQAKQAGGGAPLSPSLLMAEALLLLDGAAEAPAARARAAAKVVHLHPGYRPAWQQLTAAQTA